MAKIDRREILKASVGVLLSGAMPDVIHPVDAFSWGRFNEPYRPSSAWKNIVRDQMDWLAGRHGGSWRMNWNAHQHEVVEVSYFIDGVEGRWAFSVFEDVVRSENRGVAFFHVSQRIAYMLWDMAH